MNNAEVQVTADALTSLRTSSPLAAALGLDCPYDHLFANDAGKQLAAMALSLDPVYEQYNVVRYKWFTEQLDGAAGQFDQILLLGAGFDTRALTRPGLERWKLYRFRIGFPQHAGAETGGSGKGGDRGTALHPLRPGRPREG